MREVIKQRIFSYIILGVLCAIMPYITAIVLIIATGDRIIGLSYCFIPSTIIAHFIFAIVFLKVKKILKYTLPLVTALISIIGTYFFGSLNLFHIEFDMYGYWDMVLIHFIIATTTWEIIYHILKLLKTERIENEKRDKLGEY
ncbi:MAG: hypothetical protein LBI82_00775 [Dysgonamonadaceae bacterium]|jgi:hypothetical protein|nr:hypothetical protein [Dysgonamonadaceae bacterium]